MDSKKNIIMLSTFIKLMYRDSEVTSGEFIHFLKFDRMFSTFHPTEINRYQVMTAIQEFLDWDESPETFDVVLQDEIFIVTYPKTD